MNKSKVFIAEKTYAQNISAYMQADAAKRNVNSIEEYRRIISSAIGTEITPTGFRNWFNGRSTPRLPYLVKLADFYGCDIYELIYNEVE